MSGSGFGVIFDMDGVLIDSAMPHFQSWQILASEQGATITAEQFHATFGRQNKDVVPALFGESSLGEVQRLADRKEELYRDLIRANPPIVPSAIELIRALAQRRTAMAVGSSGPRANIELVLEAMGVRDLMSAIVSGDEVTRGKPDPQVFKLSCEKLALPPARCVVIEDAPVGVDAAKAAGAKAVAILMHHPPEGFSHADLIIGRLSELTCDRLRALF